MKKIPISIALIIASVTLYGQKQELVHPKLNDSIAAILLITPPDSILYSNSEVRLFLDM